jgi:hypothetical protein
MAPVPATIAPDVPVIVVQPLSEAPGAGTSARREWGINRLRSALLEMRTANDEARDMERAIPKCKFKHNHLFTFVYRKWLTNFVGRRILGRVFPSLL